MHYALCDQEHIGSAEALAVWSSKCQLRRVWVKRAFGTPTAIMVASDQIVDDLKQAVLHKFPNSLGCHYDPAQIQILVRPLVDRSGQAGWRSKKKPPYRAAEDEARSAPGASRSAGATGFPGSAGSAGFPGSFGMPGSFPASSSANTGKPNSGGNAGAGNRMRSSSGAGSGADPEWLDSYIVLSPDRLVWDVINEYCGGNITIDDAFLVDVEANELPQPTTRTVDESFPIWFNRSPGELLTDKLPFPMRLVNPRSRTSTLENGYHQPRPQYTHETIEKDHYHKNRSASLSFGSRKGLEFSASGPPKNPNLLSSSLNSANIASKNIRSQPVLLLPNNFSPEDLRHRPTASDGNVAALARVVDGSDQRTDEKVDLELQKTLLLSKNSSTPNLSDAVPRSLDVQALKLKDNSKLTTFEKVLPLISVLVVEDNSINQAILGAFLRKHKIHYSIAKNGQEAVDKWRQGGFHLVLMDIQLPVKSGIEATKEIRNLERINRIGVFAQHELADAAAQAQEELTDDQKLDLSLFRSPVIIVALTASSNSSVDKKNALTAGCNDFLTKPVNLVWLQNKINEWGCMQALIDFDGWKEKRTLGLNGLKKEVEM